MKAAGFSLVELLVATTIVIVGVASLAQLFVIASNSSRLAHSSSIALLIAQQKLEALLADSIALDPSPPRTLGADMPPYVEYIGADGTVLAPSVTTPPVGTVFVRRWSIGLLSWNSQSGVVLEVVVTPWTLSRQNVGGTAHLVAVKRR